MKNFQHLFTKKRAQKRNLDFNDIFPLDGFEDNFEDSREFEDDIYFDSSFDGDDHRDAEENKVDVLFENFEAALQTEDYILIKQTLKAYPKGEEPYILNMAIDYERMEALEMAVQSIKQEARFERLCLTFIYGSKFHKDAKGVFKCFDVNIFQKILLETKRADERFTLLRDDEARAIIVNAYRIASRLQKHMANKNGRPAYNLTVTKPPKFRT